MKHAQDTNSRLTPLITEHLALSTPAMAIEATVPSVRRRRVGSSLKNHRSLEALFQYEDDASPSPSSRSTCEMPTKNPLEETPSTYCSSSSASCSASSSTASTPASSSSSARTTPVWTKNKKRASPHELHAASIHHEGNHPTHPTDKQAEQDNASSSAFVIRKKWKRGVLQQLSRRHAHSHRHKQEHQDRENDPVGIKHQSLRPVLSRSVSSHSVFLQSTTSTVTATARTCVSIMASTSSSTTVVDTFLPHKPVLPTIRSSHHPDLNVISPQTVADLLSGVYDDQLRAYALIDCRFDYEYHGGSIKGSISLNDPSRVEERFLHTPIEHSKQTALVFFCEFSANRAPKMMRHLRNLDRWIHAEQYPELFYPELYLIDGGYKNCFESLKDTICEPPTYVCMSDKAFIDVCKAEFALWRNHWKQHKTTTCAAKFQQLHHSAADEQANAPPPPPVNVRSFSQQL